jgi:hypothetical protein
VVTFEIVGLDSTGVGRRADMRACAAVQIDNEYEENERTAAYMQALEEAFRSSDLLVPLTYNDPNERESFVNGTVRALSWPRVRNISLKACAGLGGHIWSRRVPAALRLLEPADVVPRR